MTLLAFMPGPDILYTISQTLKHGLRVGWAIVAGLATGLVTHLASLVIGISLIISQYPSLLVLIKIIGIVYLIYLCHATWQDFRSSKGIINDTPSVVPESTKKAISSYYKRAFLMNLTNPKVMLFFLAFMPQFIGPNSSYWHIAAITTLVITSCVISFGTVAHLAHWAQQFLKSQRNQKNVQFIAFAAFCCVTLFISADLIWEVLQTV